MISPLLLLLYRKLCARKGMGTESVGKAAGDGKLKEEEQRIKNAP